MPTLIHLLSFCIVPRSINIFDFIVKSPIVRSGGDPNCFESGAECGSSKQEEGPRQNKVLVKILFWNIDGATCCLLILLTHIPSIEWSIKITLSSSLSYWEIDSNLKQDMCCNHSVQSCQPAAPNINPKVSLLLIAEPSVSSFLGDIANVWSAIAHH